MGFAEFVLFVAITKQIERLIAEDPVFVQTAFPNGTRGREAFIELGSLQVCGWVPHGARGGYECERERLFILLPFLFFCRRFMFLPRAPPPPPPQSWTPPPPPPPPPPPRG